MRLAPHAARRGLSLLEVLVAMAIFLFALVGLGQLLGLCSDIALETQYANRAAQMCQSKMNEVVCGAQSVSSGGSGSFDEEPDWSWTIDSQSEGSVPNLYRVTVTVTRSRRDGTQFEAKLTQLVLDPTAKGTIEAPPTTDSGSGTTPGGGS